MEILFLFNKSTRCIPVFSVVCIRAKIRNTSASLCLQKNSYTKCVKISKSGNILYNGSTNLIGRTFFQTCLRFRYPHRDVSPPLDSRCKVPLSRFFFFNHKEKSIQHKPGVAEAWRKLIRSCLFSSRSSAGR